MPMRVYVINGPMGVGKTTVGKCLADSLPGTAFIDGDWCFDLHPFVGNVETKAMAVDNILHMIANYGKCSACRAVVLVWLMDDAWVLDEITSGIRSLGMQPVPVTLLCGRDELIARWKADGKCEWRTDKWLNVSLKSLPYFAEQNNCIDTTGLSVPEVAKIIINQ